MKTSKLKSFVFGLAFLGSMAFGGIKRMGRHRWILLGEEILMVVFVVNQRKVASIQHLAKLLKLLGLKESAFALNSC